MKTVLVVLPIEEKHRPILEAAAPGCRFVYTDAAQATEAQIQDANIILGNVPPALLHAPEKLEFMALGTAGADAYVKPGLLAKNTVLTNATGVFTKPVAEFGLALTLLLMKRLHEYRDYQKLPLWKSAGMLVSPADSVVLVVGLGDIGMRYAGFMKGLGAHVIGVKRRPSACPDCVDELFTTDRLEEVIGRADVIFSVLPGTKATYHLYNAEMFKKMKPSAIFINCGRGSSVDLDELCDALEAGTIRAAACDVFETEPLPAEHRAWKEPQLVITPHRAGNFDLPGTVDDLAELSAKNLKAWLEGGKLTNVVDFETGYKK